MIYEEVPTHQKMTKWSPRGAPKGVPGHPKWSPAGSIMDALGIPKRTFGDAAAIKYTQKDLVRFSPAHFG
jgi:hypothetical protein